MQRILLAFLPALLLTYLIASALATQTIIADVQALGMPVTLRDRVVASARDMLGLALIYLPTLLLVMALALAIATWVGSYLLRFRGFLYPLFTALAVLALHLGLRAALGFDLLTAVRTDIGLALQVFAAWLGGYFYYMFLGLARR